MTDKPPIFPYDDRYFLNCKYTREQLYELQEQILVLFEKNPDTVLYEIKKITNIDEKEIQAILTWKDYYEKTQGENKL